MIEEDAVAGVKTVRLPIVHGYPVGINLSSSVWGTLIEGRGLTLWHFLNLAEHLGGRSLIEAGLLFQPQNSNGFQDSQRAHGVGIGGVFRGLEGNRHVALRG